MTEYLDQFAIAIMTDSLKKKKIIQNITMSDKRCHKSLMTLCNIGNEKSPYSTNQDSDV